MKELYKNGKRQGSSNEKIGEWMEQRFDTNRRIKKETRREKI